MLLRQRVVSTAVRIADPQDRPVRLQVWAQGGVSSRTTNTAPTIYLSHLKEQCTRAEGTPLPMEQPVLIDLEAGQSLYAISSDEGFVGISVLER